MKKTVITLAVIAIIALLAYSQRASIAARLMERGLETRMGANIVDDLDDGLHLALCGAGGPLPAPRASGPCVAVVAGTKLYMVDAGTDGVRNLARMGYQLNNTLMIFCSVSALPVLALKLTISRLLTDFFYKT